MYSVQSPAPITRFKSRSGLSDTRQGDHHSVTLTSAPVPAAGPTGSLVREVVFGVSIFAFPAPMRKDCAVPAHRSPSQALGTPSRALGVRAWLSYCSRLLLFVAAWCTQGTDIWCSGGRYLAKGGQDVQFEIPTPLPDIWQRVLAMQISGTCLPPDIRPSVRGSIRYLAW